jgi:uncharacterized membrane-anchored protein
VNISFKTLRGLFLLNFLLAFTFAMPAYADDSTQPSQSQNASDAAFKAATDAMQRGPTTITLRDQASLKLPEGYGFIPQAQAQQLLSAMGNGNAGGLEGMIYPLKESASNWFMVVTYDAAGYVKDDDAKNWNADELLDSLREGTKAQNEERAKMGIPEMDIIGWVQKPLYSSVSHQLVWSISSKDKGSPTAENAGINYNTLALGRDGYFSVNLVSDLTAIEALKPEAKELLSALEFNNGKRYADFNSSTDKVAEYGLAALVAGVAAKKLGFFALIAVFLAKFAKIAFIAVIAGGAAIRKFFQRDKAS